MSMSSASKTTQCNMGQDESFIHDVFCCISYITHKSPLMQELFSKWLALNSGEAALLNYVSFHIYSTSDMCIYTGIIKAINFWNAIQDTEGACGYHNNLVEFGLNKEQEKQIFKVIMDTSEIISTIVKKAELCEQIRETKVTSFNRTLMFLQMHNQGGDA
ncbi:uncharacterized protein [Euwallacea fornicatus]|uniref:uncharacterized protein n=1 Tax=Euwallacea fornicatus TaxID=995702 RepID=UPI00338D3EFC